MNISAKFQVHPTYDDLLIFFCKFRLSVAMATNKVHDLDKIHMVRRGLLKEQFCKTFVKISLMRQQ